MKTGLVAIGIFLIIGMSLAQETFRTEQVRSAAAIMGLEFTDSEIDSMKKDLQEQLDYYATNRNTDIANRISPVMEFDPIPTGFRMPQGDSYFRLAPLSGVKLPADRTELAFYSIRQLAALIRERKITSVELTTFFIERLKKYDPVLHCVITLTEERALAEARKADAEIEAGQYRGFLHGIPFGAKDLLAAQGYKTTWGAEPYKEQVLAEDAEVIRRLNNAGAVLVAKLTLGALAWGDVWFGGKTRTPWNTELGSSGSSAGSASATAAGLVPFAIGSETWGSIVSPSTRCGTTGLRPSYGRVSRTGAMALSWSMDKLGPICRSAEDCAIVFDAIVGPDPADRTVFDLPFRFDAQRDVKTIRIGYLQKELETGYDWQPFDQAVIDRLRQDGIEVVPVNLPEFNVFPLSIILSAESAAAFDELTRSNRDDLLVRQIRNAWPNVFRASRFIPAVEYIQANRLRRLLMDQMEQLMQTVDVYIAPSFEGNNLLLTNLSGHPCVVMPTGFAEDGTPVSTTIVGKLFDEANLLRVAARYQQLTGFHLQHPKQFTQ